MENKLQLVKHKIDWLKLIKMAFVRKDWGKSYNLYIHKDVTVSIIMSSFNFECNAASFKIKVEYPKDDYYDIWNNCSIADIQLDNFSIDNMNKYVIKRTISLLKIIIERRLRGIAKEKYEVLEYDYSDINDDLKEKYSFYNRYKDLENLEDEDNKAFMIDKLNDRLIDKANEEFERKVDLYSENYSNDNTNLTEFRKIIKDEHNDDINS